MNKALRPALFLVAMKDNGVPVIKSLVIKVTEQEYLEAVHLERFDTMLDESILGPLVGFCEEEIPKGMLDDFKSGAFKAWDRHSTPKAYFDALKQYKF